MQDDRLRLLAIWHGLRRDVDLLLAPLLSHGPVAVARVSSHLDELQVVVQREQAGFEALRRACEHADPDLPVDRDDLAPVRARSQALPPGRADELEQDATVLRLPDRT